MAALPNELIAAVHRGPLERTPWKTFLSSLRKCFGANYVNFSIRRPGDVSHSIDGTEGANFPFHVRQAYAEKFKAMDPIPYLSMTPGRAYRVEQLCSVADFEQDPFFQEFLKLGGIRYMMIVHCREASGYMAWLTVALGPEHENFDAAALDLLEQIALHFSIALENYAATETMRLERDVHAGITRRMNVRSLLIDDTGKLLDKDICGNGTVDQISGLTVDREGYLRASDPVTDRKLQSALREILQGTGSENHLLCVSEAPRTEVLLARLDHPRRVFRSRLPQIVAHVHLGAPSMDQKSIAQLYHLTKTEAAVAAKLAAGDTLIEAAASLGITEHTVRTYSKRLFHKTGTAGQSDLVRMILTSAAAFSGSAVM
jgi:DNA-binding CsgD family transcriptional regulator